MMVNMALGRLLPLPCGMGTDHWNVWHVNSHESSSGISRLDFERLESAYYSKLSPRLIGLILVVAMYIPRPRSIQGSGLTSNFLSAKIKDGMEAAPPAPLLSSDDAGSANVQK